MCLVALRSLQDRKEELVPGERFQTKQNYLVTGCSFLEILKTRQNCSGF
jgi:hypothetical protein